MTAAAPSGHHSTEPQRRLGNQTKTSIGPLCPFHPDVMAAANAAGITRERSLRHLQAEYDRMVASADADFDFGAHVLTYLAHGRSVPVDVSTGERAIKHLMKRGNR